MIERDHVGQAGLAALGWLDDTERADFEHECLINPDVGATRAEVCDLIAAVAATAPPADPPPHALAAIFSRLPAPGQAARPSSPASRWQQLLAGRVVPWAAAAGFALVAAWMSWRSHDTVARSRQQLLEKSDASARTAGEAGSGRTASPGREGPGSPSQSDGGDEAPGSEGLPLRYFSNRPGDPELRLRQDSERLRTEVAKLRAAEQARQQLPSGISDLRVVEMLPPGAKKSQEKSALLSARVVEAIASGLKTSAPASPEPKPAATPTAPDPLRLRGQGANPTEDIVIDSGLVNIGTLNLHPDAQVVHKNFPPPEDFARLGLTPLDAQTVYDGQGGLWHRSADGTEWIGQKAPPSFTPPDPDDGAPGAAPPLRPKPTPTAAPAAAGSAAEAGVPYALPVLDQQGRGTLIVQNLPPAPEGEFYYLWMTDPRFSGPVNVGVLPAIETAFDHFGFDLGTPGFVPTGYLLTLEKAGAEPAPKTPGGAIVLQGP